MEENKGVDGKFFAFIASAFIIGALLGVVAASLFLVETKTAAATLAPKVESYITSNFLASTNATAKIKNWTEQPGIIIYTMDVMQGGQAVWEGDIYATRDGKSIIIGGTIYNLNESISSNTNTTQQPAQTQAPKSDTPEVNLFVMAFCPYGQQAEAGMLPVAKLLGNSIKFALHYVIYDGAYYQNSSTYCIDGLCSMHGVSELREDMRQMCIKKLYPDKLFDYIDRIDANCTAQNVDSCWTGIAQEFSMNTSQVEGCVSTDGLAMAGAEKALGDSLQVQGSPTFFINGVEVSGGRAAEDFKTAVCGAFNTPPAACNQTLGNQTAAAAGSCG
jgi:hypothetical protein